MGYRWDDLVPGEIYHVCTRGVEKRDVFLDNADRQRFLLLLHHCLPQTQVKSLSLIKQADYIPKRPKLNEGLADLLAYCLMANHVHLLLRENTEKGISLYMRRVLTSYACYFNKKYERSGSLFLHPFKAVLVNNDEQLLHVSRYIHLNPVVAKITSNAFDYSWSSIKEYMRDRSSEKYCHTELIKSIIKPRDYLKFVSDEADYVWSINNLISERLLVDFGD